MVVSSSSISICDWFRSDHKFTNADGFWKLNANAIIEIAAIIE